VISKNNLILKISGESFLRGHGSPDFIINASSIKHWTDKATRINYIIDNNEKNQIINYVLTALRQKGWNIESE
jgi:hypothetical protein